MTENHKAAVIFDVDGPLLDLTAAEEDLFFAPFEAQYGLTGLSRDWGSYTIRNDIEIVREILRRHLRRAPTAQEIASVCDAYVTALAASYDAQTLKVVPITGARNLLEKLATEPHITLGIATANLGKAARLRLEHANLWSFVHRHPGAAEHGGTKSDILARVLDRIDVPRNRVVFLGDNLNDLEAARAACVQFIGFHTDENRRQHLTEAGASLACGDHETTWRLIQDVLRTD